MITVDASDPGKGAVVNYVAAWLFTQTSMMNAANAERARHGEAAVYHEHSYEVAIKDAEELLRRGGAA